MQTRDSRRVTLVLAFAGMGVTASVVPAVLPSLAADAGLPVSDYLDVVPALFGGLFLGVLLSTLLARFCPPHVILTTGAVLQFAGFASVALAVASAHLVGASVITGVGFGLAEASGSVLARAVAAERTTSLLAALTGTVAAVAAICPLLLALVLSDGNARLMVAAASLIHLLGAMLVLANRAAFRTPPAATPSADGHTPERAALVLTVLVTGFALFLYVGVETVFSGWSAVLAGELLQLDSATAALGTSAFWALMAAGRFIAWLVLKSRLAPAAYLLINCGGAALVLVGTAILAPGGGLLGAIGVSLTIVFLAPCYSLILGIGLSRMQLTDAARTTGLLVAAGAAGGSAIPLVILTLSEQPAGELVIAISGCLMLALSAVASAPLIGRARGGVGQPSAAVTADHG
jgi:fucose permease